MKRGLWKSIDGVDYDHRHCGNCIYSVQGTRKRYSRFEDMGCKFSAVCVSNGNEVVVISRCSGAEHSYDADVVDFKGLTDR